MLFYTPTSKELAERLDIPKGSCTIKQFTDGEWHVTVHDDVQNKQVWVLGQTGAPADSIIQLLLLCNALQRSGAQLNLLISYFGYARQDKAQKGESLGADIMCRLLHMLRPQRVAVIHLHNPEICEGILPHENHIPYRFFYDCVHDADVIVSPDKGARQLATHIAQHTHKEVIVCEKHRPEPEQVILQFTGDVAGKRVLIVDDMITTGGTIIRAANLLLEQGAKTVRVAATHGVFAGNALKALNESSIEDIRVTNTLEQAHRSEKVTIVDVAPWIQNVIDNKRD